MYATSPDLPAALLEELKWEGLDGIHRTNLKQCLDQDLSQCWVPRGFCHGPMVPLPLSPALPPLLCLCHLTFVCCCFSSERTHHWLWFPKVTEGYPPAPRWPRALAKGQHKVYCSVQCGKDGYCMFLSESARLCEYDGPALVPNPDKLTKNAQSATGALGELCYLLRHS